MSVRQQFKIKSKKHTLSDRAQLTYLDTIQNCFNTIHDVFNTGQDLIAADIELAVIARKMKKIAEVNPKSHIRDKVVSQSHEFMKDLGALYIKAESVDLKKYIVDHVTSAAGFVARHAYNNEQCDQAIESLQYLTGKMAAAHDVQKMRVADMMRSLEDRKDRIKHDADRTHRMLEKLGLGVGTGA